MKTRTTLFAYGAAGLAFLSGAVAFGQENGFNPQAMATAGVFMTVFMVIGIGLYVYMALALQTIAGKTNTENGWLAWIPIANLILMLNIAKKPMWWIILCLIPLVNIVILIPIWMAIAEARQKPSWWGIMVIVPIMNLVMPGYLAWAQ